MANLHIFHRIIKSILNKNYTDNLPLFFLNIHQNVTIQHVVSPLSSKNITKKKIGKILTVYGSGQVNIR